MVEVKILDKDVPEKEPGSVGFPGVHLEKQAQEQKPDESKPDEKKPEKSPEAPFGWTLDGKPKKSAAGRKPKSKTRQKILNEDDNTLPDPPLREPKVGGRVPVGKAADPYQQLDATLKHQKKLVDQIRKEHPNSNIGDPVDPRDASVRVLEKPLVPIDVITSPVKATYMLLADVTDCKHIPSDKSFEEVARSYGEASRYMGAGLNPGTLAILGAIACTIALMFPIALAGAQKIKERREERRKLLMDGEVK